jgi:hypothetical protein
MVYLEKFAKMIPYWKVQGKEAVSDFLKKRSDILLEKLQNKDKRRAKSGLPYQRSSQEMRKISRQGSAARIRRE